jgi:hypothetical protein
MLQQFQLTSLALKCRTNLYVYWTFLQNVLCKAEWMLDVRKSNFVRILKMLLHLIWKTNEIIFISQFNTAICFHGLLEKLQVATMSRSFILASQKGFGDTKFGAILFKMQHLELNSGLGLKKAPKSEHFNSVCLCVWFHVYDYFSTDGA